MVRTLSAGLMRRANARLPAPVDWKDRLLDAMDGGSLPTKAARSLNVHNITLYTALREDQDFAARYEVAKRQAHLTKYVLYTDGTGESPLTEGPRQVKFFAALAAGEQLAKVLLSWSITRYALIMVLKLDPAFRESFIKAMQDGVRARWEAEVMGEEARA